MVEDDGTVCGGEVLGFFFLDGGGGAAGAGGGAVLRACGGVPFEGDYVVDLDGEDARGVGGVRWDIADAGFLLRVDFTVCGFEFLSVLDMLDYYRYWSRISP